MKCILYLDAEVTLLTNFVDDCESDSFTICGRGDSARKQPTWKGDGSEHSYEVSRGGCVV